MQKITPCLWFGDQIEEAVNFYVSVFRDGKVLSCARRPADGLRPAGTVLTMTFKIQGQEFMALNGGAQHPFTEAVSFFVRCDSQAEVDYYWNSFINHGGTESQCGWLKDKYGLSWQIVPTVLGDYLRDKNPESAKRVMQAMLQMKKIDIAALDRAHAI